MGPVKCSPSLRTLKHVWGQTWTQHWGGKWWEGDLHTLFLCILRSFSFRFVLICPCPRTPTCIPFLPLKPERSQHIFCSVFRSLNTSKKQGASRRRGERLTEFRHMSREARDQWAPCKSGWLQPLLPIGLGLSPATIPFAASPSDTGNPGC